MLILVANVGSTSFKYRLFQYPGETLAAQGRIERIGAGAGTASWKHGDSTGGAEAEFPTHREAIQFTLAQLERDGALGGEGLGCVAFKTVIAKGLVGCELLDERVLKAMEDYVFLAPAHNPPYIAAIRLFRELLPETPLVGLFEPAFHLTMPDYARVYPIPKEWREKHAIQRYGFHGASHRYVSQRVPQLMNREPDEINIISCHLGGSSSMCAIQSGRSIDTTMGFTPQTGLFHATRVGDFDPFAVLYMMKVEGLSVDDAVEQLTRESGLKGLSGGSDDMRDIEEAMDAGDDNARLAFEALCYAIKKYIGAYVAVLGRVDCVAFAGGIGERGWRVREKALSGLEHLGIYLDEDKNKQCVGDEGAIHGVTAPTAIWVVPTNEELIVARAAYERLQTA
ncbi:MAG: acetate/propionate family kinase [bacterium]|nr:acetate/propionate family kinase [bacterium]